MENIKKFDIKSFIIGVFVMGVITLVLTYYMRIKIQETHQLLPKISYNSKGEGYVDNSEWLGKNTKNPESYPRIFDKNKLVPIIRTGMGKVNNQLSIYTKNIKRAELEKIIHNNVSMSFVILNFENEGKNWIVDFNTDKAPIIELKKIFGDYDVSYREVILPEYFNENNIYKVIYSMAWGIN